MAGNINLDGGEITILKALGLGGSEITGEQLMSRIPDQAPAELIDSIQSLVMMGYVVSDTAGFKKLEDLKNARLHVNSGYARELKEAMDPTPEHPKSRRVRRE
jgi:hypothetical protein